MLRLDKRCSSTFDLRSKFSSRDSTCGIHDGMSIFLKYARLPSPFLLVAETVMQVERAVVDAFVELVTKLNDTAFRPLFRKLFDWAFTGESRAVIDHDTLSESSSVPESSAERKIAFCNTYMGLLDYFKVTYPVLSLIRYVLTLYSRWHSR